MEDKATRGGSNTPSEEELSALIRAEVETWKPRRGPDWSDMMVRLAVSGPSPWIVYTTASAALVVILVGAYLVGSWLQLGALGPQPVQFHH
ncbi:MAG TPA: hypothetical protein VET26_04150 [Candidatus Sulfotelmatobacter sp.]|nr:hypothetical protein [Candidatus Sulfotelmatobacter sp.]